MGRKRRRRKKVAAAKETISLLSVDSTFKDDDEILDKKPSTSDAGTSDELTFYFKVLRCLESPQKPDSSTSPMEAEASSSKPPMIAPLRTCASCHKIELQSYSFKKCQKCDDDDFKEKRYYCSKACQVDDWIEFHRDEHRMKES